MKKQIKPAIGNPGKKDLNANFQKVSSIPDLIYELNGQLEELCLTGNKITKCDQVAHISSLKRLYLSNNKLCHVPQLQGLNQLTHLILSYNRLEVFPQGITSCGNLKHLDLSGNRMVEIPEKIRLMQSLKALYICNNLLESFQVAICEIQGMETLSIRSNDITMLPDELGQMKKLKRFYAQDNRLQYMPETIIQCPWEAPSAVVRLTKNPLVPTFQVAYDQRGIRGIFPLYRSGKFSIIKGEAKPIDKLKKRKK